MSIFGNGLSDELEAVEGKRKEEIAAKRKRILDQWLTPVTGDEGAVQPGQYADPAARSKE